MLYNYEKRVEDIVPRVDDLIRSEKNTLTQALIYAGLSRFVPILPKKEYDSFIRDVLINQSLAWREQIDTEVLGNCNIINPHNVLEGKPAIYCAFHNSSYRLNMLYLLRRKIPVVLIASSDIIEKQTKDIFNSISAVADDAILKIIDANAPASIRTMLHELSEGHSLFVYLDGNTGSDGMSNDNKNLVEIPILGSSIMARKGVAAVSYIAGVPMIPMIASRNGDNFPDIEVFDKIVPDKTMSRDEYSNYVTRKIYRDVLEKQLARNPRQWEPWLYLYRFFQREEHTVVDRNVYFFNEKKFCLLKKNNSHLVFAYNGINAFEISQDSWLSLDKGYLRKADIPSEEFNELLESSVII